MRLLVVTFVRGFGFFKIEFGRSPFVVIGIDGSVGIGIGGKRCPLILALNDFDKSLVVIDIKFFVQ